jgi:hypothetical protein
MKEVRIVEPALIVTSFVHTLTTTNSGAFRALAVSVKCSDFLFCSLFLCRRLPQRATKFRFARHAYYQSIIPIDPLITAVFRVSLELARVEICMVSFVQEAQCSKLNGIRCLSSHGQHSSRTFCSLSRCSCMRANRLLTRQVCQYRNAREMGDRAKASDKAAVCIENVFRQSHRAWVVTTGGSIVGGAESLNHYWGCTGDAAGRHHLMSFRCSSRDSEQDA